MKYTYSLIRSIKPYVNIIMFLLCLVSYSCGGSDDGISGPPENSGTDPAPDPDDPSDDWRTLYNGIILPSVWPPKDINISSYEPMKVPYLQTPPEVIPIDVGRQLFFDNFLIDNTDLVRKFYKPKKYAQNPILKPETALETSNIPGASAKDGGVWWEPREQIFKMWYEAGWLNKMAYATSNDGVNWVRPDLNNGSNELLTLSRFPANSCAVVLDYEASDNERYKMFLRSPNADATDNAGYCMISSNGKQWSWFTKTGPCGDRSTMFYNPFRKKWVFSIRTLGVLGNSPHGRARYYREHSDFLTGAVWTKADVVFWCNADNKDTPDPEFNLPPELYNLNAVGYESIMLGLHQILLDENEIAKAAENFIEEGKAKDQKTAQRTERYLQFVADGLKPENGVVTVFEEDLTPFELKRFAGMLKEKFPNEAVGVFSPIEGGFNYVIASSNPELPKISKSLNGQLNGRGGGRDGIVQGTYRADKDGVEGAFRKAFAK